MPAFYINFHQPSNDHLRRCTNDLLLSYLFYREEALAPFWSNTFANQILGYETPEHNRLYAQQGEHTSQEMMSYFVKQISNRSFVHRI
jgi:uncharacterized membrane protein